MEKTTIRVSVALFLVASLAILPAAWAQATVTSETSLYLFETPSVLGDDQRHTAIYEHLSVDMADVGTDGLDLHLYGWGRVDPNSDGDTSAGELSSGYLEYLHGSGARARVGRFFFTEGTSSEVIDGLLVKGSLPMGFGGSLFIGNPVEDTGTSGEGGDNLFGGRGYYAPGSRLEIGVSWLTETGDFNGDDRKEAGADVWLMPTESLEVFGRSTYNLATEGIASYRAAVKFSLSEPLTLEVGGEGYQNEHLLQGVTNPAFGMSTLDPDDEVTVTFALVDWQATGSLDVTCAFRNVSHSLDDPGNFNRGELELRLVPFTGTLVGFSAASVTADRPENEYRELRGFIMTGVGSLDLSLDALSVSYEEPVDGEDTALQLVGSAGLELMPDLRVSGDVRYLTSPTFDKDVSLFIRAIYTL
jgi:hypothetical protein